MSRGDLVVVAAPGDYGKPRPAAIVQSKAIPESHASVVICPMTSELVEAEFRITIEPGPDTGLQVRSQVMADTAMAPCRNSAMLRDNAIIAAAMLKAAATTQLGQVVNISSDAIYADSATPLTEASVKAPESLHGVMHLAREITFASEIKAPLAMLRPTLIYGAADPHNGYGPNRFLRLAAAGEPITLFGKGEERRDHVLVDDVAEMAKRVIYRRSTGALNIATGTIASFHDIAKMVVRMSSRPVPIRELPRTGPMPHNGYRAFDITACRAAFPEFAFTPLERGLMKTMEEA